LQKKKTREVLISKNTGGEQGGGVKHKIYQPPDEENSKGVLCLWNEAKRGRLGARCCKKKRKLPGRNMPVEGKKRTKTPIVGNGRKKHCISNLKGRVERKPRKWQEKTAKGSENEKTREKRF